jgi:hypothetical protein
VRKAVIVAALCMLLTPAAAAKALPETIVPPAKLATLLLPDDVVGSIIGLPMPMLGTPSPAPARAFTLREHNDCKALIVADVDVWTGDFTAFRNVVQQDLPGGDHQFFVSQSAATYPSSQTATQVFQRTYNYDLQSRCGVVLPDFSDEHVQWRVDGISITSSRASWSAIQIFDGQDTMWRCSGEFRTQSNVMYMDVECQNGNGTSLVKQIADMTAGRFPA